MSSFHHTQRVDELLLSGFTIERVREITGASTSFISERRKALNLSKHCHFDRKKIEDLLRQGLSAKKVAQEVGCSIIWVFQVRAPMKLRSSVKGLDYEKMDELLIEDRPTKEIANLVGCSCASVVNRRRKLGIKTKPGRRSYGERKSAQ